MIKNFKPALALLAITILSFGLISGVGASRLLTEKQIKGISKTCVSAQVDLNNLHNGDALMRANLGQQYETILNDLMLPFNGRLDANGAKNQKLIEITDDYKQSLDTFRSKYMQYERSMRSVMNMDCASQPIKFYELIKDLRKQRSALHKQVSLLNSHIKQYHKQFKKVKSSWEASNA